MQVKFLCFDRRINYNQHHRCNSLQKTLKILTLEMFLKFEVLGISVSNEEILSEFGKMR